SGKARCTDQKPNPPTTNASTPTTTTTISRSLRSHEYFWEGRAAAVVVSVMTWPFTNASGGIVSPLRLRDPDHFQPVTPAAGRLGAYRAAVQAVSGVDEFNDFLFS